MNNRSKLTKYLHKIKMVEMVVCHRALLVKVQLHIMIKKEGIIRLEIMIGRFHNMNKERLRNARTTYFVSLLELFLFSLHHLKTVILKEDHLYIRLMRKSGSSFSYSFLYFSYLNSTL